MPQPDFIASNRELTIEMFAKKLTLDVNFKLGSDKPVSYSSFVITVIIETFVNCYKT